MGRSVASEIGNLTMNLAVLKKSRRKLKAGDIFVMLPLDGLYLYGRVMSTDARAGWSMPGANLIYVYRPRTRQKLPVPELLREHLLVPPMMTNNLPWSKGYFEFIESREIRAKDRLDQHCFKDSRGRYFDEQCKALAQAVEPIGQWGLHSYRTIDDEVSKALGIPLVSGPESA